MKFVRVEIYYLVPPQSYVEDLLHFLARVSTYFLLLVLLANIATKKALYLDGILSWASFFEEACVCSMKNCKIRPLKLQKSFLRNEEEV